jgi:hypothetical protein
MPKQQIYVEPIPLCHLLEAEVTTQTLGGNYGTQGQNFFAPSGAGVGTFGISQGVLALSITTAPKVLEVKYLTTADADINKIRCKPNTQYTMKCKIRCISATSAPTGATIRLVEVNAFGTQVATINSPTTLVVAVQEYVETVLNFTTGSQTAFLSPIFSLNGGATGLQFVLFKDFDISETL